MKLITKFGEKAEDLSVYFTPQNRDRTLYVRGMPYGTESNDVIKLFEKYKITENEIKWQGING